MSNFSLTLSAAEKINELKNIENDQDTRLRIEVLGGGCSGFQYKFSLDKNHDDKDKVYKLNNSEVVIDEVSLKLLDNSMLDYIEDLSGASFIISNPNAKAKCGCGNSFST